MIEESNRTNAGTSDQATPPLTNASTSTPSKEKGEPEVPRSQLDSPPTSVLKKSSEKQSSKQVSVRPSVEMSPITPAGPATLTVGQIGQSVSTLKTSSKEQSVPRQINASAVTKVQDTAGSSSKQSTQLPKHAPPEPKTPKTTAQPSNQSSQKLTATAQKATSTQAPVPEKSPTPTAATTQASGKRPTNPPVQSSATLLLPKPSVPSAPSSTKQWSRVSQPSRPSTVQQSLSASTLPLAPSSAKSSTSAFTKSSQSHLSQKVSLQGQRPIPIHPAPVPIPITTARAVPSVVPNTPLKAIVPQTNVPARVAAKPVLLSSGQPGSQPPVLQKTNPTTLQKARPAITPARPQAPSLTQAQRQAQVAQAHARVAHAQQNVAKATAQMHAARLHAQAQAAHAQAQAQAQAQAHAHAHAAQMTAARNAAARNVGTHLTQKTGQPPSGSSAAREIARLITNYLGANHPPPDTLTLPTLNALRTRLTTNPAHYEAKPESLSWQTREALRTEFFKIIYPTAPSQRLLTLVTQSEMFLTPYMAAPRPFFFPGARVAVPTEAGSRRAATTLQLRFKKVGKDTVTESLLHLDGPAGGGFQWVQTSALMPLSVFTDPMKKPNIATPRPRKKPRAPRAPRPRKPRAVPIPPVKVAVTKPVPTKTVAAKTLPGKAPLKLNPKPPSKPTTKSSAKSTKTTYVPQAPKPLPSTQASQSTAPAPKALPKMTNVVARLARQEASGVHVPSALRSTSPPPKQRLLGEGRQVSHMSGCMRTSLAGGDLKNILGIQRLIARRMIVGRKERVEYFVKWSGVSIKEGSWEQREDLMQDVPGLVRDFDVRHPGEIAKVREEERSEEELDNQTTENDGVSKDAPSMENTPTKKADVEMKAGPAEEESPKMDIVGDIFGSSEGQKENGSNIKKEGSVVKEEISKSDEKDKQTGKDGKGKADSASEKVKKKVKHYTDDVTGIAIPSWLDTPILELSICGMILQVRRPDEAVLHNDATTAVRDAKKRQTRFKQENLADGEQLFPLTKPEAKAVIEASAKSHRQHNRTAIPFPKGIGRVSPGDHGYAFSVKDALMGPASWEGYLSYLGLRPTDYTRELPPYMPTLDEGSQGRLIRAREDFAYTTVCEHRERARSLLRDSFRHTGAPPPQHIFRDGVRAPPGSEMNHKRKRAVGKIENGRGIRQQEIGELAFKKAKMVGKDAVGAWYDEVWACWRPGQQ